MRAMLEDDTDGIVVCVVNYGQKRTLVNLLGDLTKRLILVPLQNPHNSHVFYIFSRRRCRPVESSLKRVAWAKFDNLVAFWSRSGCNGSPAGSRFGARSIIGFCGIRYGLTRDDWTHEEGVHVPLGCAVVEGFDHVAGPLRHDVGCFVLAFIAQLRCVRYIYRG